jgi:hypothetical protein
MSNASSLVRALRGPVLLVTTGTLFAIDHATDWNFMQTWPVLVIVFGLMKFWELALTRKPQDPSHPIPGGTAS